MEEKQRPINVEKAERKKAETTRQKKKKFVSTFAARLCNVSKTCKVVGIARQTFYRWCDEDDKFKKEVDNQYEEFYDDIETTMFSKAIEEQDTTMLIWLSKTKMKHRGYVETMKQEVTVNPFEQLMKAASITDGDK